MTDKLNKFLQSLIESEHEACSQLLLEFGEEREATPENLLKAYMVYGEPFMDKLYEIADQASLAIPDSDPNDVLNLLGGMFKNKVKKTPEEKKASLQNLLSIGASVFSAAKGLKQTVQQSAQQADQGASQEQAHQHPKQDPPKQDDKIMGMSKPVFAIAIVVCLALVFVVIKTLKK
jgi:hypothetical protein